MRTYPVDSPQAVARAIVMSLMVDARVEDAELDALEELSVFDALGITRGGFAAVVRDYCADVAARAARRGRVRLVDPAVIDEVVAPVRDPDLRVLACRIMARTMHADGELARVELAVLHRVLERWGLVMRPEGAGSRVAEAA